MATVRVLVDVVLLAQGRALAGLVLGSAVVEPDRQVATRLARAIAGRMAEAIRRSSRRAGGADSAPNLSNMAGQDTSETAVVGIGNWC